MAGGKPENPEKNHRSRDENQQQIQPTYDAGSGNRTRDTLVEASALTTVLSLLPMQRLEETEFIKATVRLGLTVIYFPIFRQARPDLFRECLQLMTVVTI